MPREAEAAMTGRVVHFEIPYDDQDRANAFYTEAFGWTLTALPELAYVLATTAPRDQAPPREPGFINGGLLARGLTGGGTEPGFVNGRLLERRRRVGGPLVVLGVEDVEAALEQIEKLGGTAVSA